MFAALRHAVTSAAGPAGAAEPAPAEGALIAGALSRQVCDGLDRQMSAIENEMRRTTAALSSAVDRNGYVACHNRKYNHPQRAGDVVWNTANCRNRRIFNDRTGLAAARNQRPFLLQTCRRDMGGGHFVVMKEAAAPITVDGRHWGGLRLAFHF